MATSAAPPSSAPVGGGPAPESVERGDDVPRDRSDAGPDGPLPRLSGWVVVTAAVITAVLVAVSDRYGYHRDELYFLEAGKHLTWGYPDMPPLVPALARALSAVAPGSLPVLRLPSALAAGAVVVMTGLTTREFGGGRSAQVLAAVTTAGSALLLGSEHYLETSGVDLASTTLILWLVVRLLRTGDGRLWLAIGVATALGLQASDLTATVIVAVVVAVLAGRRRRLLLSPWALAAAVVIVASWAPYLVWQADHGWPERAVASAIARGGSGTSTPRWLLLPTQLVLVSPYLAPVWISGLVRLVRAPGLRWCRPVGVAYLVLAAVYLATGGKSYYLGVVLPVLVAAGAQPVVDWLGRGRSAVRKALVAAAIALTIPTTALVMLPVLPVTDLHDTPIVTMNYDEGETVGWPAYVDQIDAAFRRLPADQRMAAAVLTANYGEAGAVDRFGPGLGLPTAYSGQDGFWYWGPPPARATVFVVVGLGGATLRRVFSTCRTVGHLDNGVGVDDQEQRVPLRICTGRHLPWSRGWIDLRVLG